MGIKWDRWLQGDYLRHLYLATRRFGGDLEVPGRHVVSGRVAQHVLQGVRLRHVLGVLANHNRYLPFVVQHALGVRVDGDIVVRASQGIGRLSEDDRVRGDFELCTT